jgi:hypothetical protein
MKQEDGSPAFLPWFSILKQKNRPSAPEKNVNFFRNYDKIRVVQKDGIVREMGVLC